MLTNSSPDKNQLPLHRRRVLAASGASIATLAGCGGSDNEDTDPPEDDSNLDGDGGDEEAEQPPAEFEIEVDAPSSASLDEDVSITATVENVGEDSGTFRESLEYATSYVIEPERWNSTVFSESLSPGEETQFTSTLRRSEPGFIHYRIMDKTGRIDVPAHRAPIITDASLVTEWNSFGDLEDNRIDTATVGDLIIVAHRHWLYIDDGSLDVFEQIDIRDSEGTRVAMDTSEDEQIFDLNGWEVFEFASQFGTDSWDPGTYTAEIRIRNNATDEVSERFTYDFTVE